MEEYLIDIKSFFLIFLGSNRYLLQICPKKVRAILDGFSETVDKFNRKPNKVWVDQEKELYNKLMEKWLDHNDVFHLQ